MRVDIFVVLALLLGEALGYSCGVLFIYPGIINPSPNTHLLNASCTIWCKIQNTNSLKPKNVSPSLNS